ncbi:MAG: hypothetical protein A2031_06420 [Deltaproteobacteria bacterium RBG_19FT_COMBO_43_11]|nr:MAG: hypothetical protein A2W27_00450 [Deltaproteobacteria bacterium RBG_16_44_11]OGP87329.1 MAG: hypothetical protein A2031_06420 [Deltaproteobacteria bacterium RBG_19FT_COMBO_43_11]
MLVAIDKEKVRYISWLTEKYQAPFFCPACGDEVILKKGGKREHHFAHKPPFDCIYSSGESQKHYKVKRLIYTALSKHDNCHKCDIERPLDGVRPDISLYIGKTPVAIEIQKSNIDLNDILRRTKQYTKLGIHLLWVSPDNMPNSLSFVEDEDIYIWRPKEWQKFLHAMYFGRIYFWQHDAFVMPIHLNQYEYYKEPGNWVDDFYEAEGIDLEGTSWHDENHPNADYGGCWKTSKTKKVVMCGKSVHIANSFNGTFRSAFNIKNWSLPSAKIWIDVQGKWW